MTVSVSLLFIVHRIVSQNKRIINTFIFSVLATLISFFFDRIFHFQGTSVYQPPRLNPVTITRENNCREMPTVYDFEQITTAHSNFNQQISASNMSSSNSRSNVGHARYARPFFANNRKPLPITVAAASLGIFLSSPSTQFFIIRLRFPLNRQNRLNLAF